MQIIVLIYANYCSKLKNKNKKPVEQSSYPQPRSHLGYTEGRLISLLHVHTSPKTANIIIIHSTTKKKITEP